MIDPQLPPDQAAVQCSAFDEVSVSAASAKRRAGQFAEAALLAQCTLSLHPLDADAWFELGAAKSALDARADARNAWLRTLDLAPSNDDARLGLAGLAWRDGDVEAARRWLDAVSPQRQRDEDVLHLRARLDAPGKSTTGWRLEVSAAQSSLTGGLPDWTEARVSLSRASEPMGFGVAIEHARRFDREDTFLELAATHKTGATVWSLSLGGAPKADFRPEVSIRAGAEYYGDAWYVAGEIAHAEYAVGPVEKIGVRGARTVGGGLTLQASLVGVQDENGTGRLGYGLGAQWQATPALLFDAGWSDAPESSDGATVDVQSAVVGGALEISPDLRVRVGIMREFRDAYDRTELSIGLAKTF